MLLDHLTWLLVAGSLIGGQLIIGKKKSGYLIWVLINLLWVSFYLYKELYSSVFLFLVFMVQAMLGYVKWSRNENS
ncbi:nicotinamide mononucleotide transporter [uncultured Shewanella sp.]|uniref:nicotinamide mononucleotide transporter n=1 Tax=uncultured Shewanella sp. TaxID=173975 RepID=UPI002624B586|nr:nicotinamide mononucleotide transporter [uncultured Shewanella sp.]